MRTGLILGIESSCDETSAAVVRNGREVLSNVVASQLVHSNYGGVVPELASREHLRAIVPVVREAMHRANVRYSDLDAVAVTEGPGLAGALLVGITFAKSLAFGAELPLIAVNHLEGHIHAVLMDSENPGAPFIASSRDERMDASTLLALVVSGGHTHLYLATRTPQSTWHYRNVGKTLDDAAGEAYDKAAKLLGLPYPGGPWMDALAAHGNPKAVPFTFAQIKTKATGKTAPKLAREIEAQASEAKELPRKAEAAVGETKGAASEARGAASKTEEAASEARGAASKTEGAAAEARGAACKTEGAVGFSPLTAAATKGALAPEVIDPTGEPTALKGTGFSPSIRAAPEGASAPEETPTRFDLSFSGIKTAVRRYVELHAMSDRVTTRTAALREAGLHHAKPSDPAILAQALPLFDSETLDLIASFQASVTGYLTRTAFAAAEHFGARSLLVSGGVAANRELRHRITAEAERRNIAVAFPSIALSTDNAAMIAAAAWPKLLAGRFADDTLEPTPQLRLG